MAVKPEKIKERLKALWPKANLSTKRLDAIADKLAKKPADDADDAAIDAVLNEANDFIAFEDIAKEDDRVRTLEEKLKTPSPTPAPAPTPTPTPTPSDDVPAWAQAMIDSNKKLSEDLEAIKTGKITDSKKSVAQQKFEASEVFKNMKPELKAKWLERVQNGVKPETTDDEIDASIKEFETEYTDLTQHFADTSNISGLPPVHSRSNGDDKMSDEEAARIVDSIL